MCLFLYQKLKNLVLEVYAVYDFLNPIRELVIVKLKPKIICIRNVCRIENIKSLGWDIFYNYIMS